VIEIIDSDMNQQDIADVGYEASAFWSLAPCFWNSVVAGFIPAQVMVLESRDKPRP
jgi:hypothetical protein